VLQLTADNAEVGPIDSATTAGAESLEKDPSFLLPQWQDSVVAVWTPDTRASGFVIDARGLVATNQRVIGAATSVEVQLTTTLKVTARVLVADAARDVAVLWVDRNAVASLRPVPLGCGQTAKPPVADGQKIFTIAAPLREPKAMESGKISRVEPHAIVSDLMLASGSSGGPVFTAGGEVIGITSLVEEKDDRKRGDASVVRIDDVCGVLAAAEKKMNEAAPPSGTHLPVEPVRPFPVAALKDATQRARSLGAYQLSSSDFDVVLITPVLTYGAQNRPEQTGGGERRSGARAPGAEQTSMRALLDFSNWSEYVADFPPVLLVRVTPKLVEGFWTTVARGAAMTQGMSLPPIKHFKSGFSRLRALCGDVEVTPIHPFTLEQRVSETDAIHEGLYVFDPGALGPQCGSVKLVLYSEKEPQKGDTREVDPKMLQQVWQDFAPYRAQPDQ
jgi:S1-C subfamily serine protease